MILGSGGIFIISFSHMLIVGVVQHGNLPINSLSITFSKFPSLPEITPTVHAMLERSAFPWSLLIWVLGKNSIPYIQKFFSKHYIIIHLDIIAQTCSAALNYTLHTFLTYINIRVPVPESRYPHIFTGSLDIRYRQH